MTMLLKLRLALLLLFLIAPASHGAGRAWLLEIDGAIGPASADYVIRGIDQASDAGAQLVLLRIDTPGGLDRAMRDMIKHILGAPIPIVSYVSPSGARAASAGTYLLYASHVAAMAPATNLGSATPVQIGAPSLTPPKTPGDSGEEQAAAPASAMEKKIINDAVAYIRGLATLRKRNVEWAELAVREAANIPAEEALQTNVIDVVASDIDDLMRQLHGRTIALESGEVTLDTTDIVVEIHRPDWRSEFLSVITDPNIAYILMLVGIYGLIFEFSNPGMVAPGIVGAVSLLTALYAFQVLPVSYAGAGLMLLGLALMTMEAFAPSFGVLGIGGMVAFVLGSIFLIDTDIPAYRIALPVIGALTFSSAALLVLLLGMVIRARRQPVVSGVAVYKGLTAVVETVHLGEPLVRLDGELWQVVCSADLNVGDRVNVVTTRGLRLEVQVEQGDTQ